MKVTDLKVICTAPEGIRLVVVKIETDAGISGLGCATFTQLPLTVVSALENYYKPLILGRRVEEISDAWQAMYVSGYWRNGPVLNNAISGIDQALWDIKGKSLGVPVFELLGGKMRDSLDTYVHVNGKNSGEVSSKIELLSSKGFKNFRIQFEIDGLASYGTGKSLIGAFGEQPTQSYRLSLDQNRWDEDLYINKTLEDLRALRILQPNIGLIHDVHERISPERALQFAKSVENLGLLFLEDPVSPENLEYLKDFRALCTTPIAFGELLHGWSDFTRIVEGRLVNFIRCHITQIGGITPTIKLAHLAEAFGIKTAWHGPGDLSPVGHAAHLHLGLATENFGIQEIYLHGENSSKVFQGIPEIVDGKIMQNSRPGFGIDIDENAAAEYPYPSHPYNGAWPEIRRFDGSIIRP